MSYFLSVQLFLYPEVYIFFLSLVLSCPGDLAREGTLSSVFFILFSLLFSVPDWSWTVSSFACKCDLCFCLFTETHLCLFRG